jgi:hypothetical protein
MFLSAQRWRYFMTAQTCLNDDQLERLHRAYQESPLTTTSNHKEVDAILKAINRIGMWRISATIINEVVMALHAQWKVGFIDLLSLNVELPKFQGLAEQIVRVLHEYYEGISKQHRQTDGGRSAESFSQPFSFWVNFPYSLFAEEMDEEIRKFMQSTTHTAFIPPCEGSTAKYEFDVPPRRVRTFTDQQSYQNALTWAMLFCLMMKVMRLLPGTNECLLLGKVLV